MAKVLKKRYMDNSVLLIDNNVSQVGFGECH